ncbi:MAG: hypothetical protein LBK44_01365 [Spirochaetales bacterium]|nr:hypothetical protein [Spirochaetales bacterium]
MQILWAFRYNPWRLGEQRICECKFATSPWRAQAADMLYAINAHNTDWLQSCQRTSPL